MAGTYTNTKTVALVFISILLASSCAQTRTRRLGAPGQQLAGSPSNPRTIEEVIGGDNSENGDASSDDYNHTPEMSMKDDGQIVFRGKKLKNSRFDFPVTVNSRVEFWVDYFCGRGRMHYEKYLERSEYFIPFIRPLLKENGMPLDLVYLSMIESGFNNLAKSRAKAVGPWQFMSATGKRYGLKVNWWVDERRDIRKSTLAAIQYLRDLYNMFGSWELAAAGYNAGESKVARAVQRYGTKDFWAIARQKYLRPETRDYVPKLIAAAIIDKNREQFGFSSVSSRPAGDEAIAPSGEVVKVIRSDKPDRREVPEDSNAIEGAKTQKELEANSSMVSTNEANGDPENPENQQDDSDSLEIDASAQMRKTPVVVRGGTPLTPMLSKSGEVGGELLLEFEIESPSDLLDIAQASGLSYQTVKSLNPELMRWVTPPNGSIGTYPIKLPFSVKDRFLKEYNSPEFVRRVQFLSYITKAGDNLSRIAARFGIKVDPVVDLNRISARVQLKKGMKILLPIPSDRKRSLASLEVQDPPEKRSKTRARPGKVKSSRHHRISSKDRRSARERNRSGI